MSSIKEYLTTEKVFHPVMLGLDALNAALTLRESSYNYLARSVKGWSGGRPRDMLFGLVDIIGIIKNVVSLVRHWESEAEFDPPRKVSLIRCAGVAIATVAASIICVRMLNRNFTPVVDYKALVEVTCKATGIQPSQIMIDSTPGDWIYQVIRIVRMFSNLITGAVTKKNRAMLNFHNLLQVVCVWQKADRHWLSVTLGNLSLKKFSVLSIADWKEFFQRMFLKVPESSGRSYIVKYGDRVKVHDWKATFSLIIPKGYKSSLQDVVTTVCKCAKQLNGDGVWGLLRSQQGTYACSVHLNKPFQVVQEAVQPILYGITGLAGISIKGMWPRACHMDF